MSAPAAAAQPVRQTLRLKERANPVATRLCLLVTDASAILLARRLGAALWTLVNSSIKTENEFDLWTSICLFLAIYAATGLYSASGLSPVEELRRIVQGAALVSLVLT